VYGLERWWTASTRPACYRHDTPDGGAKEQRVPELRATVEREALARLGAAEADAFLTRLDQLSFDILEPLGQVYGAVTDPGQLATELVLDALDAAARRPQTQRLLDRRREIDPAWFQRSRMIGYVCYADRFARSLPGVRQHLD